MESGCCNTKDSRPDIANATWELSKVMDGTNTAALFEMHHVIKYVVGTRNLMLRIEQNKNRKEP